MRRIIFICLIEAAGVAAFLSIASQAIADPISPTLLVSNAVNPNISTLTEPADPRNSVSYFASYWNVDQGEDVQVRVPYIYGDGSASWSISTGNSNRFTRSENTANPLTLDATSVDEAKGDGTGPAYINTGSAARSWYVLTGGEGTVDLRVDVAFYGRLYAAGEDSVTHFTHQVQFLSAPDDMTIERVLVINGAKGVNVDCSSGFGQPGTVSNRCENSEGELIVNNIIRSNPFTVTFGVPFRLTLWVATNAATETGYAISDFSDPRLAISGDFPGIGGLTPEGFIVDLDGNWETPDDVAPLGQFDYRLSAVPEPNTLVLLAVGLTAIVVLGRRR